MSFNELAKQAGNNGGGKASETLPPPDVRRDINTSIPDATPVLPKDSKLIAREGRDYKIRADRFRNFREGDILQDMDDANYAMKVAKEYKKNIADKDRVRQMRLLRLELERSRIIPLQMPAIPPLSLSFLPPSLVAVADSLSRLTGLVALGIVYALLGAISIATWGRVTIRLGDHWSEAAVTMLLQVSPSGTRKSALVRELRAPFEHYCTKVNEGHEDRMRQAQCERQWRDKAAAKLAHKELASTLSSIQSMDAEAIALIKATGSKVAAFKQKLQSDCEIKESVRLLVDKATPFQLAAALQQQGECQGCITAEGSMIQGKMLRPDAVDLFLRTHTQEPYIYENAKKRIDLSHPALPMINLVQPEVAAKFYSNETLNEMGATARFVPYFYESQNGGLDVPPSGMPHEGIGGYDPDDDLGGHPNTSIECYSNVITRLLSTYHTQDKTAEQYQVTLEIEAVRLIQDFEQEIRRDVIPSMPEAAIPCLLKAHGQAVRFAWNIHAWNHATPHSLPITAKEMEQGIELVRATFEHIRYAYDLCGLQAYLHAQKILDSLKNITERYEQDRLLDEGTDSSTIQRRTKLKAEVTNNALRLFDEHNYLAVYDDATANLKIVLHSYFFNRNMW